MVEDLLFIKRISFHFSEEDFMTQRIMFDIVEGWLIVKNPEDPENNIYFQGKIYNPGMGFNGELIETARIVAYYPGRDLFSDENGKLYRLGRVHPEYEKKFPNAKRRLLASLRYGIQSPS